MATPSELAERLRSYATSIESGDLPTDRFVLLINNVIGVAGFENNTPELNEAFDRVAVEWNNVLKDA